MLCVFKKPMCCDCGISFCVSVAEAGYMNVFVNASDYACLTDAKWSIIVLKPVSSEEEHEAGSDISGNNKRPQSWMRFLGDSNRIALSHSTV